MANLFGSLILLLPKRETSYLVCGFRYDYTLNNRVPIPSS